MKKQQVFPPSQAPSQWSRWVTFLYGTAPHTRAAHTCTHTHAHTWYTSKVGVYITRTRRRHVVYEWYRCARIYIYICRTGPGPRGPPIENTFINIFFQCHGTSTNCARHLHVCTPSKIDLMALYAHVVSINYRKLGNFGVKNFSCDNFSC